MNRLNSRKISRSRQVCPADLSTEIRGHVFSCPGRVNDCSQGGESTASMNDDATSGQPRRGHAHATGLRRASSRYLEDARHARPASTGCWMRRRAVLYVGKARNLKARVSNYARPSGTARRIARMIRETASMMFLTTRTETEALLLEQNLIKQLKPRYNVLLRDDKCVPEHPGRQRPRLSRRSRSTAARKKEKGSYYGPFASAGAVNRTLNQLQKVFLLRNCSDAMFESRTRPCLLYQIKRCSRALRRPYLRGRTTRALVADAERFLQGKSTNVQAHLAARDAAGLRGDGVRARRGAARPDPGADPGAVGAGHQPARRGRGRRDRAAHGGRAGLRAGLLHPREPELGQPRLLPPHRRRAPRRARCWRPSSRQFYDDKEPPRR